MEPGATAQLLEEVDGIVSKARNLLVTLEGSGADTDELRESLAFAIERNLLECYGAPTLARYIAREATSRAPSTGE